MRKFVISDLHGNGEVYNTIISYLDYVSLVEDVELYINGDLFDRGLESFTVLMDVYERINGKGNVKIKYLGGNHELMMWQAIKDREPGKSIRNWCNWLCNGGWIIEGEMNLRDDGEELYHKLFNFLGNLDVYKKLDETVNGNNILLVHAQAPKNIKDICHMKISDDSDAVEKAVWTRKSICDEKKKYIGKEGYLTIIGHTPVEDDRGFIYNKEENYFNIDGGCACFANGSFEYRSVPLLEIKDGFINIIVFNHNNEITNGYIFDGKLYKMSDFEMACIRVFINHKYDNCEEKQKQLIREIQGII